jgi:hypothetical protein
MEYPPIPRARQISGLTARKYQEALRACRHFSVQARTNADDDAQAAVSALEVVGDLLKRCDISPATRRTYISALLWGFRTRQRESEAPAYWRLMEFGAVHRTPAGDRDPVDAERRRTPISKTISDADLERLLDKLNETAHRAKWTCRALWWVVAGLGTGVRAVEWLTAVWIDEGHTSISVQTAKQHVSAPAFLPDSSDRGDRLPVSRQILIFGAPRDVPIPNGFVRTAVEAHMAALKVMQRGTLDERYEIFRKYYELCGQSLRRACVAIWKGKKRFTLRTMRSQASANFKAVFGTERTSNLLGHTRPDSPSSSHYAKASQAHAKFKGQRQDSDYRSSERDGSSDRYSPDQGQSE